MRLHVVSDLHLEFGAFALPRPPADAVVLAGDVALGTAGVAMARRIARGRPVLFVAGNHEPYRHALPALTARLRAAAGARARERRDPPRRRALPRLHAVERLPGRRRRLARGGDVAVRAPSPAI